MIYNKFIYLKMYCNYCSKIYKKDEHLCKKEEIYDKYYDYVKDKNVIDLIFSYKRDLEYEEDEIKLGRYNFMEIYSNMKNLKVINNFNNCLEIEYKHTYCADMKFLFENIKVQNKEVIFKSKIRLIDNIRFEDEDYDIIREKYLKTIDIPLYTILKKFRRRSSSMLELNRLFQEEVEKHFSNLTYRNGKKYFL